MKNKIKNEIIIDAMLEEWLGRRALRPLSVDELNQPIDPKRAAEFDMALRAASSDIRQRSLATPSSVYRRRRSYSLSLKVIAALAACLMIAAGYWAFENRAQFIDSNPSDSPVLLAHDSNVEVESNGSDSQTKNQNLSAKAELENGVAKSVDGKSLASKNERESMSLNGLPFSPTEQSTAKRKMRLEKNDRGDQWNETDVVAAMDQQLQSLWKNHAAQPAVPVSAKTWIERATKLLISRSATQEEVDAFVKKDTPATRLETLHRIANSPEFTQVWSRRLAAHYLDAENIPPREFTDERRAFVQWIRKEMGATPRLDVVAKSILQAKGIDAENAELAPIHHWWSEASLGEKSGPAGFVLSKFLGARASCSKCHSSDTVAQTDQSQYWGIAAITQGIEVVRSLNGSSSKLSFKSIAEPLFYERRDATMVAAHPALPNGHTLADLQGRPGQVRSVAKENLNTLSNWMVGSDEFSRSHSNFVWKSLMGQPLTTSYPLDASEGAIERAAIADLLGQQLRANDFDLRQLVVWVAASQAFSLDATSHDGNWYLTASEKDVDTFRHRQRLFASFSTPLDRSLRSMDSLAKWFDSTSGFKSENGTTLANPIPLVAPNGKSTKPNPGKGGLGSKIAEFTGGQVQYLISAQSLPKALGAEVDRMMKANLDWAVMVEHAFYMTGEAAPSISDREAAQRILDLSRDKRLAITRIIAARL